MEEGRGKMEAKEKMLGLRHVFAVRWCRKFREAATDFFIAKAPIILEPQETRSDFP
jgi:hypothetical protein